MALRRPPDGHTGRSARRDLRVAWVAVALMPVALVVAIALGEIVAGALGYPAGGEKTTPVGVRVLLGLPATLLFVAPGIVAGRFGLRARREGEPRGVWPAGIGLGLGAFFVLQSALAFIAGLF